MTCVDYHDGARIVKCLEGAIVATQDEPPQPPKDPFDGFEGYTSPHYTQIPDLFLDKHVRLLTGAEVKIMLALFRATIGWRQTWRELSAKQLAAKSGVSERRVQTLVPRLEARGLIRVRRTINRLGDANANLYAIRWCNASGTGVKK